MTTEAVYDRIGKTYDQTRKADPEIVKRILNHLSPTKEDIASGEIKKIIESHESDLGDYVFITCTKR